jgi:hypothetical protein
MKKIIHEPLVHFLLLGVFVFAGFKLFAKTESNQPGKIVVTQGQVQSLVAGFTRTWQRPPTTEELDGLIQEYIREEVCTREAMALGLDKDDTVIRRRLRQKVEFISESVAAQARPTDPQLQTYLEQHADKFRSEDELSFKQVYLNPERHGANAARDASSLLARLKQRAEADISQLGDSFLLGQNFQSVRTSEISKQFGEQFVSKLRELPVGSWEGPIESGYGLHLVQVTARNAGQTPSFKDVRESVQREWSNAQREEINEKFYQELLKRYTVTIEAPLFAKTQ